MAPWVVWLVVALALLIVEMLAPGTFFLAAFGIGSLLAAILSYLHKPAWIVWTAFFGSSILLILVARPILRRYLKGDLKPSNADELIGKKALVMEAIAPHKPGLIKVGGEQWKAYSEDAILEGVEVEVVKIEGTGAFVKKGGIHGK